MNDVVVIVGLTATHIELDKSFIVFPDNCLAWPRAILLFGETRQDGMVWTVSRQGEVCSCALLGGALVMQCPSRVQIF